MTKGFSPVLSYPPRKGGHPPRRRGRPGSGEVDRVGSIDTRTWAARPRPRSMTDGTADGLTSRPGSGGPWVHRPILTDSDPDDWCKMLGFSPRKDLAVRTPNAARRATRALKPAIDTLETRKLLSTATA